MFDVDVCIVGTGRVGLPLALSLIDVGLSVVGVDIDENLREAVNGGRMPFHEPGYDELVASRRLTVHATHEVVARCRTIIITVGTPLHNHIESDLSQVQKVLERIAPYLVEGQLVCLRSTVAPGTTAFVRSWLERYTAHRIGERLLLAFCPERIAEGKARQELRSLPQIIGTGDPVSRAAAEALFQRLTGDILHTDYVSAELVKLFNNIARYVHFALANQFALIADTFGANIYEILRMANHRYPRNPIAVPGLTAGTCLRKDFGMINEWSPYPDMLLSAWKMNEYVPAFLVKHMLQRTQLHDRRVAILGWSFKADTDDVRDSLSPKLMRYISRELPLEVRASDHHLPDPLPDTGGLKNHDLDQALAEADCVFVAMNHSRYQEAIRRLAASRPHAWIADIWNLGGIDQIFYQAREVLR
jgi:UDP-N-acetyl-D-mannosaminuronic acid dehydrogenase